MVVQLVPFEEYVRPKVLLGYALMPTQRANWLLTILNEEAMAVIFDIVATLDQVPARELLEYIVIRLLPYSIRAYIYLPLK